MGRCGARGVGFGRSAKANAGSAELLAHVRPSHCRRLWSGCGRRWLCGWLPRCSMRTAQASFFSAKAAFFVCRMFMASTFATAPIPRSLSLSRHQRCVQAVTRVARIRQLFAEGCHRSVQRQKSPCQCDDIPVASHVQESGACASPSQLLGGMITFSRCTRSRRTQPTRRKWFRLPGECPPYTSRQYTSLHHRMGYRCRSWCHRAARSCSSH